VLYDDEWLRKQEMSRRWALSILKKAAIFSGILLYIGIWLRETKLGIILIIVGIVFLIVLLLIYELN